MFIKNRINSYIKKNKFRLGAHCDECVTEFVNAKVFFFNKYANL